MQSSQSWDNLKIIKLMTLTTKSNYQSSQDYYYTPKKLYRDKDNALLGGVMSGLGHFWRRSFMVTFNNGHFIFRIWNRYYYLFNSMDSTP